MNISQHIKADKNFMDYRDLLKKEKLCDIIKILLNEKTAFKFLLCIDVSTQTLRGLIKMNYCS